MTKPLGRLKYESLTLANDNLLSVFNGIAAIFPTANATGFINSDLSERKCPQTDEGVIAARRQRFFRLSAVKSDEIKGRGNQQRPAGGRSDP